MIDEKFLNVLNDPSKKFIKEEDFKMHYVFTNRKIMNPCSRECNNRDKNGYPIEIIYDYGEDEVYTKCCTHKFSVESFHRTLYGEFNGEFNRCLDYVKIQKKIHEIKGNKLTLEIKNHANILLNKKFRTLDLIFVYDTFTEKYYNLCKSINDEDKDYFDKLISDNEFVSEMIIKTDIFRSNLNPFTYSFFADTSYYLMKLLNILPSSLIDAQFPLYFKTRKFYLHYDKRKDTWTFAAKCSWFEEVKHILKDKNINYDRDDNILIEDRYNLFSNTDFRAKSKIFKTNFVNNFDPLFGEYWKELIKNHYLDSEVIHLLLRDLVHVSIDQDLMLKINFLIEKEILNLDEEFMGKSHRDFILSFRDKDKALDIIKIHDKIINKKKFINSVN